MARAADCLTPVVGVCEAIDKVEMASSPRAEEARSAQVRTSRETSVRCGEVENQVPAVPDSETPHRAGLRLDVATLQGLNEFSTCRGAGIVGSSHFRFLIMFHLTGQTLGCTR